MRTPFTTDTQRAWVDVDLDAIVRNARSYQGRVGVPLLPMLKADAYGLGALKIAKALQAVQPMGWGVATTAEAVELRRAGFQEPIIVFTPLIAGQLAEHRTFGLRPVIGDLEALRGWLAASEDPFHLEIDTGMRRAGLPWDDRGTLAAAGTLLHDRASWEGCFTHFHSAGADDFATALQWERFQAAIEMLGRRPPIVHAANGAAGGDGDRYAGTLARPGICLYGAGATGFACEPVAALRARIVALRAVQPGDTVSYGATWEASRSTTIATLSVGYADGVHRTLSSVGSVEIGERRCPIVGRVTMDFTMVDIGDVPVEIGDVATLFGGMITLDEQAANAGTIAYELLTSLGHRLPRIYHRS
ncbi:MAG TPA: alanine racemase [Gemmatimonadales bacterium]|nr:alanine racemase [Gemmatimonadales bacterium]